MEHLKNADIPRVAATREWDNIWRHYLPKTHPVSTGAVCAEVSCCFFNPNWFVKRKIQGHSRGRRALEKVVYESKQCTIKERFPWAGSQPFNLNRSLNDATPYLNLLLPLPGRDDSRERVWFPTSCSTPVSQQERTRGLNSQLVQESAALMKLLELLCISQAE